MRRILFAVLVISLLLVSNSSAGHLSSRGAPYLLEATNTLLSAVTATGVGSSIDLGGNASKHTCTVTWGGTVPTSTLINIWGSVDNTFPATSTTLYLTQQNVTATKRTFHIVNKPVRYLLGEYVSKVAGDDTTSVTIVCTSQQ